MGQFLVAAPEAAGPAGGWVACFVDPKGMSQREHHAAMEAVKEAAWRANPGGWIQAAGDPDGKIVGRNTVHHHFGCGDGKGATFG